MTKYKIIAIKAAPNYHDVLIAALLEIGFDSFEEREDELVAYINAEFFNNELLLNTIEQINPDFTIDIEARDLENKNWNAEWESNFEPVEISPECLVRASFHQPTKFYLYDLVINPQMSFGTGHHQTTHLMLQYLLSIDLKDKKILDAGSGTGVLAILASKRGASHILAYDIEDWAYNNAIENVKVNCCNNIQVQQGTIHSINLPYNDFDVIIANINKNVLLEEISVYYRFLNRGGILLLSGFYEQDIADIEQETLKLNFILNQIHVKDSWAALMFSKM